MCERLLPLCASERGCFSLQESRQGRGGGESEKKERKGSEGAVQRRAWPECTARQCKTNKEINEPGRGRVTNTE